MNSLIFFVLIIGIDIFLKSVKDKKKMEQARQKKIYELRNKESVKTVKGPETRVKREMSKNTSLSKKIEKSQFFGEGKSYRDDHEGYQERYEERYEEISQSYKGRADNYNGLEDYNLKESLYDENAIETRKKEYEDLDIRNYGRTKEKIEIPVPTASTFKNDVLNGIIFSEILGKPKSMQKKDI